MSPIDQIQELYSKYPQERTFEQDLAIHFRTGYVISTPAYFVMGRAVDSRASAQEIADPAFVFPVEQQDTWLIYAYAGLSQNFLSFIPYPLTYVAWQRRGGSLRWYRFQTLTKRCERMMPFLTRCSNR